MLLLPGHYKRRRERAAGRFTLDTRARVAENAFMRYALGKLLELAGMALVGMALFAGLGMTPSGEPSMAKEFLFLGIGGAVFTVGWLVERGQKA